MPLNRPNPAAGRPTGPFPAVPLYIDANGVPTNDPGTEDAPGSVTAPVTAGDGAGDGAGGGAAAAGPKPFDSAKILKDNGLDATQWHVVGEPVVKPDKYGAPPSTPRSQNDYTVVVAGPNGQSRKLTLRASGEGVDDPSKTAGDLVWTTTGVEESVGPPSSGTQVTPQTAEEKAKAETQQAIAAADAAKAQLDSVQKLDANRQKNVSTRGLYLTDEEIATMDKGLKDQGLQQTQIDAQLKIASDNNSNSKISNEISAQNAATNATVAAENAKIAEARLGLDTAGLDEQKVRDAEEHAKNVFTQGQATIAAAQADRKIALDELTQQQTNLVAQGQLVNAQGTNALRATEATETARHNTATEAQAAAAAKATADAQAAANATTAAGDILKQGTTNAATGAGLLRDRITSATGALQNITSAALGSNMMNVPSGIGANLVGGLGQWVTDLGGGDATMDAAARMVQAADPKVSGNPALASQLQQTYAQILQHYQQINGQPAPLVTAVDAAKKSAAAGGGNVAAPVTTAPATTAPETTAPVTTAPETTAAGGAPVAPLAPTVNFDLLMQRQRADAALQAIQAKIMPPTPAPGAQGANGVGVPNPYATFISPVTA